jgi:hypothetical protein
MSSHFVWITAMFRDYEDLIIAGVVKKGFSVGPAAKDNKVTSGAANAASVVIALKVDSSTIIDSAKLHDEITSVLKENKMLYYSVLVSSPADCCWNGSNIVLPEPSPAPAMPGIKKTDMN